VLPQVWDDHIVTEANGETLLYIDVRPFLRDRSCGSAAHPW
jgi:hypothetical protein